MELKAMRCAVSTRRGRRSSRRPNGGAFALAVITAAAARSAGGFVGPLGRRYPGASSSPASPSSSSSTTAARSTKEPPTKKKKGANEESDNGGGDGVSGPFSDGIASGGLDLSELDPKTFAADIQAAAADYAAEAWREAASVGSFLMQRSHEEDTALEGPAKEGQGEVSAAKDRGGSSVRVWEERTEDEDEDEMGEVDGGKAAGQRARVEIIDETDVTGVGRNLADGGAEGDGGRDGKRDIGGGGVQAAEKKKAATPAVATTTEEMSRTILEEITARLEETTGGVVAPSRIDDVQARELDEAVATLKGSFDALMKDISVLPSTQSSATVLESPPRKVIDETADAEVEGGADAADEPRRRRWRRLARRGESGRPMAAAAAVAPVRTEEKIKEGRKKSSPLLPLSHPDHYTDRIGRDMRHLAVSIASSVDFAWQWRIFTEEGGGIMPLVQCIRNGARYVEAGGADAYTERNGAGGIVDLGEVYEEEFAAACAACRSLRDLCAISPEFSACVTDAMVRADAAWAMSIPNEERRGRECSSGGLMSDLVTLLKHANEADKLVGQVQSQGKGKNRSRPPSRKSRREAHRRCGLYVLQLLLAMSVASDAAVNMLRATSGLTDAVLACSSYAPKERRRRWLRYPGEVLKRKLSRSKRLDSSSGTGARASGSSRPFIAAAAVSDGLTGQIQRTANMVLAAIGYNVWVPKIPGQKGLRILCLDGGGTRGVTAITTLLSIVEAMGGMEVCDSFDIIAGTSTGAIIAFLVGLRRESSQQAKKRYDDLIGRIFVKSALSTPMLVFTTAAYDEVHFNDVMQEILRETSMLDSRADPTVPLVFALSSKMSSTPIQVALFRNYNYAGGELADPFVIDPDEARDKLGLNAEDDKISEISDWGGSGQSSGKCAPRTGDGSRHPGSFRVLQRAALRATTAAPTFFKPVKMGGELYSDGGIIASNPAAVAIHEARTLFPDVPIEMVVSCGTGAFIEEKTPPRIGWDGIIGQIVNSATDGEQIHHILEDILGQGGTARLGLSSVSKTRYYRLNPVIGMPNDFPIDETGPEKLEKLSKITKKYLQEDEQQRKLKEVSEVLEGKKGWRKLF